VKPILFVLYFFLNMGMGVIEYFCRILLFWEIWDKIHWFNYSIFICCLLAIMMITFLLYLSLLMRKTPLHRLKPETFIQYKNLEAICFSCSAEKPPRSVHCSACGICIENYDHHCLWINGCVGHHNLPRFLWFLICFVAFLLVTGVNGGLVGYSIYFTHTEIGFNTKVILLTGSGLQVLSFLSLVGPIVFLLCIQVKNVYLNKTTYERFSKLKRSRYHSQSYVIKHRLQKRQLQGSCSNIMALLCCCSKPERRLSITTINDSLEEEFF
jgi:ribosomal protein L40E